MTNFNEKETMIWTPGLIEPSDIGNHYCVNPYLFTIMSSIIKEQMKSMILADIGSGNCSLSRDFLQGASYLPHFLSEEMRTIQNSIKKAYCIEADKRLLYKEERTSAVVAKKLIKIEHLCSESDILPISCKSVDLVTSRHLVMHLNQSTYANHLSEVARILTSEGYYLMVSLNPEYEERKVGYPLQEGASYLFPTGGEEVQHYFKSDTYLINEAQKHFKLIQQHACFPITDEFHESHARYYDKSCPMAYIYVFKA